MSNNILFIFEGKKTEGKIAKSLEKNIFQDDNFSIKCAFGTDIYQLYKKIHDDEDLDLFSLIKGMNKDLLRDYNRNDFAEIYLFFDYDAHAAPKESLDKFGDKLIFGDEALKNLLELFDNETDNGKLYISYPMVEALKHVIDYGKFHEIEVKCKGKNCKNKENCDNKEECIKEPHYKDKVANESPLLSNVNRYTTEIWKKLISAHLSKMNYIVNNKYEYPSKIESQQDIFAHQLEKHINKKCPMVSVLSAFPVFIYDYYGNERTKQLLNGENITIRP